MTTAPPPTKSQEPYRIWMMRVLPEAPSFCRPICWFESHDRKDVDEWVARVWRGVVPKNAQIGRMSKAQFCTAWAMRTYQ